MIARRLCVACLGLMFMFGSGCGQPKGKVLGIAPRGAPQSILAVQAGDTPPVVTIEGRLVQICPVAGCWFRIQDDSGTIKVDTKAAGFVVLDVPLQTVVTVTGRIRSESGEATIEASGLRY
jgi:uncharacterized protein YdeI (BOF family)